MKDNDWLYEIKPKGRLLDFNLKEVLRYKDLLFLFVRRDIVAQYKQTILGPLWYLIQPLFTSVIFTLVFNNIADIGTGSVPSFLFNLAGVTMWTYFKQCLDSSSNTFSANAGLFGKVYFPRVIMPLSKAISSLFKLGIQLLIFIGFYLYFYLSIGGFGASKLVWCFPLIIFILSIFGIGLGMILSALTTKYRDFKILVGFAITLFMYISAVMYPIKAVYEKASLNEYSWVVTHNPIAILIESFRYFMFDEGSFYWSSFISVIIISLLTFFIGLIIFNKTERTFIDTI